MSRGQDTVSGSAQGMLPGIRLLGGAASAPDESVWCSTGFARGAVQYSGGRYWSESFVPQLPWRRATRDELIMLSRPDEGLRAGCWIDLFDVPANVMSNFHEIQQAAQNATCAEHLDAIKGTAGYRAAVEEALMYAKTLAGGQNKRVSGDVLFRTADLPTTAKHFKEPTLVGLHVDSTHRVPPDQRRHAPMRLCINLAAGDRFLLFVNLGLDQIATLLRAHHVEYAEAEGMPILHGFRSAFMTAFPDYPVVKVRMRPGQAYIAPTENLIHDGCTEGLRGCDVTFMAHGYFQPVSHPS